MQLGDQFESIDAARKAIKAYVLGQGESYKTVSSDKSRYILTCKDYEYKFRIQATQSKKDIVSIIVLVAYSCTLATYYNGKQSSSVQFLKSYHYANIINNRNITPTTIQANERL